MAVIQQGETTAALRRIPFRLIATADDTPITGATPTVQVRKNFGSAAAGAGTVTELAGGLYYYEATAAELDTLGVFTVEPSAAGAYALSYDSLVLDYAPTSAGIEAPANFGVMAIDSSGRMLLQPTQAGVTIPTVGTVTDGAKSVDLVALALVADAIQAVTDNLPDGGALTSLLADIAAILTDTGTTLDGKADAIQQAIAGLNDVSVAEVQAAAASAISDYDPPTRAELASDIASLAQYVDTEVQAILEDTGTTIPAQIAALNNLDAAAVQAAVEAGLTAYSAATAGDVTGAVGDLNDLDATAVQAAVAAALAAYEAAQSSDVAGAVANLATAQDVSDAQTAIIAHGDSNWTGEGSGGDSAGAIAEAVRAELAAELARIDENISSRSAAGDAMTLTSAERQTLAAAILAAEESADGVSLQGLIRLLLAWITGPVDGADGDAATLVFRSRDGSKERIRVTVDEYGNRAGAATLDLT